MAKLFKEVPLPPLRIGNRTPELGVRPPLEFDRPDRKRLLLGSKRQPGYGEFQARLYDARTVFQPNVGSRRWRLDFATDAQGYLQRDTQGNFLAQKVFGYWPDVGFDVDRSLLGEGAYAIAKRIPFGHGAFRKINAQFFQMADPATGNLVRSNGPEMVKIPKPAQLITADGPLGTETFSVFQNAVEFGQGEGFCKTPPQSHYLDADLSSASFGKWIEPERQNTIEPSTADQVYWNSSSTLRARLKQGISHLRMWCPSGEYCEFDTSDRDNYKITRAPNFNAEEASLVIKTGVDIGTDWDIYLMPRTTAISCEWHDYYFIVTLFTFWIGGFHNVRNVIDRIPSFPVPFGAYATGAEAFVSDWVYYVAQYRGAFSPGIAQAHPRPEGFGDAGGEENFNPANLPHPELWEGPPAHGSDYAIEYQVKHRLLVNHNPHSRDIFALPFFFMVYSHSSPVSFFARIAVQQPGELLAKIKVHGRNRKGSDWYYVWSRTQNSISPTRTLSWGTMFYDWTNPEGDFWTTTAALQLGGWV